MMGDMACAVPLLLAISFHLKWREGRGVNHWQKGKGATVGQRKSWEIYIGSGAPTGAVGN